MRLTHHILLSAVMAGFVWCFLRSSSAVAAAFCGGVLIDVDHWFDYLREYGPPKRIGHFFEVCYSNCGFRKLVLPLHGWEWLIVTGCAAWYYQHPPWLLGLLAGWTTHLIADQLANRPGSRWGYSLIYRCVNGFDSSLVLPRPAENTKRDEVSP